MLPRASGVPGWEPEHCLEAGWKGSRNQVYKATESRTLDVGAHTDNKYLAIQDLHRLNSLSSRKLVPNKPPSKWPSHYYTTDLARHNPTVVS
jgi:hypothetical protein